MKRWFWMLILSVMFLGGCKSWQALPAGPFESTKHRFKSSVEEGWMTLGRAPYFLMTRDGVALEYIAVSRHQMEDALEYTKKRFLPDMTLVEVADVDLDDLRLRPQVGGFELRSQEPYTIDGQNGYKFHYDYTTKEGLKVKGVHVGFVHEEWVYRIQYEAAAQYYFDAYIDFFENFLKRFQVL